MRLGATNPWTKPDAAISGENDSNVIGITRSDAHASVSYSVILGESIPYHVFPKGLYRRRYAINLACCCNVMIKLSR